MSNITIPAPRFVDAPGMRIAGVRVRYACDDTAGIPAQWARFATYVGRIPNVIDGPAWGVCACAEGGAPGDFDYYAGVEVRGEPDLPDGLSSIVLPAQRYAAFHTDDHISTIQPLFTAIWRDWLPESGYRVCGDTLERYGEEFDPHSGNGGFELWLPIAPADA